MTKRECNAKGFCQTFTEILTGGSLRKYMLNKRPGSLDMHVAIGFALDIARAMECLHSNGIIHRDLKHDQQGGQGMITVEKGDSSHQLVVVVVVLVVEKGGTNCWGSREGGRGAVAAGVLRRRSRCFLRAVVKRHALGGRPVEVLSSFCCFAFSFLVPVIIGLAVFGHEPGLHDGLGGGKRGRREVVSDGIVEEDGENGEEEGSRRWKGNAYNKKKREDSFVSYRVRGRRVNRKSQKGKRYDKDADGIWGGGGDV
ncbi:hypothetical protein L6452_04937 [Arctium lappa]|uniref:Uncharacterized protein n=1 Tax=Arctium lappa TaxID=4217 RepID=A0ACB9EFF5_ARCLA|nr:hypothetical protein L6452_04937 [Arctium lappa]